MSLPSSPHEKTAPHFTRNPVVENAALEFMPADQIKATTVRRLEQMLQVEQKKKVEVIEANEAKRNQGEVVTVAQSNPVAVKRSSASVPLNNQYSVSVSVSPAASELDFSSKISSSPKGMSSNPVLSTRDGARLRERQQDGIAQINTDIHEYPNSRLQPSFSLPLSSYESNAAFGMALDKVDKPSWSSLSHPVFSVAPEMEHMHSRIGTENVNANANANSSDALSDVIDEIEAQFGDCHQMIPKCIRQVRLLRSPQQTDLLSNYFSQDERARIWHSVKSNSRDVSWQLYRIIFDVYQFRNDTIQELNQGQLLTLEAQEYFLEKQQLLYDLITRYKHLIEQRNS